MTTTLDTQLWYGAAYYPEQWPVPEWDRDFATMAQAGMNVVRMAEFAWIALEPSEGDFRFDWLDDALTAARRHGISAILGTPTAAPPLWLTKKYPEVLNENFHGKVAVHGGRCHFSWNSPAYLAHCRRIAEAMTRRFGRDERVIGWQIDNEYSGASHDPLTTTLFREWLRKRYGTIQELNRLWGMRYWGTDLESFDDIGVHFELTTPCYHIAWRRFFTQQWISYQHNQVEVMRPHCDARQFITTNFHGMFGYGDATLIGAELDVAGFDYYTGRSGYDPLESGLMLDMVRGIKQRNFAMLEIQPWHQNWAGINADYPPGAGRAFVWQSVGHGANAVLYWQYRVASGGLEQYHGALTNAAGVPRPCYPEVTAIGAGMRQISELTAGTRCRAQCALIYRDLDRWAVDNSKHHREFSWTKHMAMHHGAMQGRGASVDIIGTTGDHAQYRLIVAPHMHLYDDATAEHLLDWVRTGGHLVLGVRSGVKDDENSLLTDSCQPGRLFVEALGAQVIDHYALDKPLGVCEVAGQVQIWAERIEITDGAEVVWTFGQENGWLAGHPALVTKRCGEGRISYVAFYPDESLAAALGAWYQKIGSLPTDAIELPAGIERCVRYGNGYTIEIWINHEASQRTITLPKTGKMIAGDAVMDGSAMVLPGHGVGVLLMQSFDPQQIPEPQTDALF